MEMTVAPKQKRRKTCDVKDRFRCYIGQLTPPQIRPTRTENGELGGDRADERAQGGERCNATEKHDFLEVPSLSGRGRRR